MAKWTRVSLAAMRKKISIDYFYDKQTFSKIVLHYSYVDPDTFLVW